MKSWTIIILCICLAVSVTACSQNGDTKESGSSQSHSISENLSTPSEQESQSELAVSSDGGESLEQNSIEENNINDNEALNPDYEKVFLAKPFLVELVRERVESYRNGTPPEATNHHPPYPSDFPSVSNLPDIQSTNDFAVRFTGNEDALGNVYLAIPIDGVCELHMTVSEYQDANNNILWGSGNTFFERVSDIQWQTQDIDLYK